MGLFHQKAFEKSLHQMLLRVLSSVSYLHVRGGEAERESKRKEGREGDGGV